MVRQCPLVCHSHPQGHERQSRRQRQRRCGAAEGQGRDGTSTQAVGNALPVALIQSLDACRCALNSVVLLCARHAGSRGAETRAGGTRGARAVRKPACRAAAGVFWCASVQHRREKGRQRGRGGRGLAASTAELGRGEQGPEPSVRRLRSSATRCRGTLLVASLRRMTCCVEAAHPSQYALRGVLPVAPAASRRQLPRPTCAQRQARRRACKERARQRPVV